MAVSMFLADLCLSNSLSRSLKHAQTYVGPEALRRVTIYSMIFWVVASCSSERAQHFRETYLPLSSVSKRRPSKKLADGGGKYHLFGKCYNDFGKVQYCENVNLEFYSLICSAINLSRNLWQVLGLLTSRKPF
jgi:hypothetical protein